jgi:hypothetical protein
MEVEVYRDFEPRKWKPKKKREAGALGAEQSKEASQRVEDAPAVHPEQKPAKRDDVMVKILRICANPRLVLCAYQDDGLERRVLVRVGRNKNFTSGMQIEAVRPVRESEPWEYRGKMPRFRGRW